MDLDSQNTDDYHVVFISRRLDVSNICGDTTRWWPLWYEYKNDETNIPFCGVRILFDLKRKPDPSKYIILTDSVHKTDASYYLHGPLNFNLYSDVLITKQNISITHWEYISTGCHTFSIVPPNLPTLTAVKGLNKKQKNELNPNYTSTRKYIQSYCL